MTKRCEIIAPFYFRVVENADPYFATGNYKFTGGRRDPPLLCGGVRVRVSGGHLCAAEAPTEPTGETTPPYENIIATL